MCQNIIIIIILIMMMIKNRAKGQTDDGWLRVDDDHDIITYTNTSSSCIDFQDFFFFLVLVSSEFQNACVSSSFCRKWFFQCGMCVSVLTLTSIQYSIDSNEWIIIDKIMMNKIFISQTKTINGIEKPGESISIRYCVNYLNIYGMEFFAFFLY